MNRHVPFLIVKRDCRDAIAWLSQQLSREGLRVVQTFDFQTARTVHDHCSCPHHDTERCNCQMAVLLIYEGGQPPVSILAHGQDGKTWFLLVDSYPKKIDAQYEARIQDMLAPFTEALMPEQWSHAA